MSGQLSLVSGDFDAASRSNLILVAEGYQDDEKGLFDKHVEQLSTRIAREAWFRPGLINVLSVWEESNESAAKLKADEGPNDTLFKAEYGGERARHVIHGNGKAVHGAIDDASYKFSEDEHYTAIVLVNCRTYGGSGGMEGGRGCWTYTDVRNPHRWTSTALHEWGHVMGLADEYGSGFGPAKETTRTKEPKQPNITLDPRGAKWRHLVNGAVDGGDGYDLGIYRPTRRCRMRSIEAPFCPVCTDHIEHELEEHIADVEELEKKITVDVGGYSREFPDSSAGAFEAVQWILKRQFG